MDVRITLLNTMNARRQLACRRGVCRRHPPPVAPGTKGDQLFCSVLPGVSHARRRASRPGLRPGLVRFRHGSVLVQRATASTQFSAPGDPHLRERNFAQPELCASTHLDSDSVSAAGWAAVHAALSPRQVKRNVPQFENVPLSRTLGNALLRASPRYDHSHPSEKPSLSGGPEDRDCPRRDCRMNKLLVV